MAKGLYIVQLSLGAIGLAIGYYTFTILSNRKKYKHIPGRPSRGIKGFYFGHALDFLNDMCSHKVLGELFTEDIEKYGDVVKYEFFNSTIVHTVDPEAIKQILVTDDFPKLPFVYKAIGYPFGERFTGDALVSTINVNNWRQKRNLFNPAFNKKELIKYLSKFNSKTDILIEKLSKSADGKTPITLLSEINRLTFDIFADVAFGVETNTINESFSQLKSYFDNILNDFDECLLDPYAPLKFYKWSKIRQFRSNIRELRQYSKETILNRFKKLKNEEYVPYDILSLILKNTDSETFEMESMIDDFLGFFAGGEETVSTSLAYFFLEIGRHPEVLKKIEEEINEVVGDRLEITNEDINKLQYMDAAWKEVLRLHPALIHFHRITTKEIVINGYKIPCGTPILLSPYSSGRCAKFFPDPLKFDPDRFIDEKKKQENLTNAYTICPFSNGPRDCLGRNFATMEAKVVITKLIQRFNFVLDETQSFEAVQYVTIKPKDGTRCYLTLKA